MFDQAVPLIAINDTVPAERKRYLRLMTQGLSNVRACREIGVRPGRPLSGGCISGCRSVLRAFEGRLVSLIKREVA